MATSNKAPSPLYPGSLAAPRDLWGPREPFSGYCEAGQAHGFLCGCRYTIPPERANLQQSTGRRIPGYMYVVPKRHRRHTGVSFRRLCEGKRNGIKGIDSFRGVNINLGIDDIGCLEVEGICC